MTEIENNLNLYSFRHSVNRLSDGRDTIISLMLSR